MARKGNSGSFGNGRKGGRTPGSQNKTTTVLKDAILEAARLSGNDKKGKNGLVGYLRRVADDDLKAFSGLLGKVLPMQVAGANGEIGTPRRVIIELDDAQSR